MDLKLLLKRGALLAAANWPIVAVQFAAQTTFQVLLAVPLIGAAILVAVLLGADLANLLQGSLREILTRIAGALMSEPVALVAFAAAFMIALLGGSVLMFLVKGGAVEVMIAANDAAGPIEGETLSFRTVREASRFTVARFVAGCARLFTPYLRIGLALVLVYALSAAGYLAFLVYGYRAAGQGSSIIGWTFLAALSTVPLVMWITLVNVLYLLMQIATAADQVRFTEAGRRVARFVRDEFRGLGGIFLVVFGMVVGATLASALAWSGVGLIAFVPLVGLAVFPLQIAALLLRGLVFEYIGLTSMGAYVTLYRRHAAAVRTVSAARENRRSEVSPASLPSEVAGVNRQPLLRRAGAKGLGAEE